MCGEGYSPTKISQRKNGIARMINTVNNHGKRLRRVNHLPVISALQCLHRIVVRPVSHIRHVTKVAMCWPKAVEPPVRENFQFTSLQVGHGPMDFSFEYLRHFGHCMNEI